MQQDLITVGTVKAYDDAGMKKILVDCKTGTKITWKCNGRRGTIDAIIVGWNDQKPDRVCIMNILLRGFGRRYWISKNSIHKVHI